MEHVVFKLEAKTKQPNRIGADLRAKVDLHTAMRLRELANEWGCSLGEAIDSVVRNFDRRYKNG